VTDSAGPERPGADSTAAPAADPQIRPLVCLVGPTAVGKTGVAILLAEAIGGEIINADSRQMYRHMDIGTAKASAEERRRVPHHLLDVVDPTEPFSAGEFARLADAAITDIRARGRVPIVVGGTGLYVRALLDGIWEAPESDLALRRALEAVRHRRGPEFMHRMLARLDPASADVLHPNDRQKVTRALEITLQCGRPAARLKSGHNFPGRHQALRIGLTRPRAELYRLIDQRVDEMISAGWVDEIRKMLDKGIRPGDPGMNAVGYRELAGVLMGEDRASLPTAVAAIKQATRNYAKRQFTWFRKDDRIAWLGVAGVPSADLLALLLSMCFQAGVTCVDVSVSVHKAPGERR